MQSLPEARRAVLFASELHRGQHRELDAAPFILHPLEVAALLHNTGHRETVITAGILHEAIEDAEITLDEVRERFGSEIAELVGAMTEDPTIAEFAQRKDALRKQIRAAGPDATSVYAADKVTKVRELRARLVAEPNTLQAQPQEQARLNHYWESLLMLEQVTPNHPLVRQLRFELEALSRLPPKRPPPEAADARVAPR